MITFSSGKRASGVLNPAGLERKMKLTRTAPSEELAAVVEHYWTVEWTLEEGETYRQYTVPHPSVHLVVAQGMSGVFGVMSRLFSYLLSGRGRVFGIKFLAGGFHSVYHKPLIRLTDARMPTARLFGEEGRRYEETLLESKGEVADLVTRAEGFLHALGPVVDDTQHLVGGMVARIAADRAVARVDDLVEIYGTGKRTLQRIFRDYVGVGPKWVISRYRLVEAADRLGSGEAVDLAALAQDLGYYDQAHLNRDFKGLTGRTPAEYARSAGK